MQTPSNLTPKSDTNSFKSKLNFFNKHASVANFDTDKRKSTISGMKNTPLTNQKLSIRYFDETNPFSKNNDSEFILEKGRKSMIPLTHAHSNSNIIHMRKLDIEEESETINDYNSIDLAQALATSFKKYTPKIHNFIIRLNKSTQKFDVIPTNETQDVKSFSLFNTEEDELNKKIGKISLGKEIINENEFMIVGNLKNEESPISYISSSNISNDAMRKGFDIFEETKLIGMMVKKWEREIVNENLENLQINLTSQIAQNKCFLNADFIKEDYKVLDFSISNSRKSFNGDFIKEDMKVLDFDIKSQRKSFNVDTIKKDIKVADFAISNYRKSFNFDLIKEDVKVLDFNIENLRRSFNIDSMIEDVKVLDFNIKNQRKTFDVDSIREDGKVLDFNIENIRKSFNYDKIKVEVKVLDFNIDNLGKSFNFDSIREERNVLDFNINNHGKTFNFDSIKEDAKVLDFNIKNIRKGFNFDSISEQKNVLDINIKNIRKGFNFNSIREDGKVLDFNIKNLRKGFNFNSIREDGKVLDFNIKNLRKTFNFELIKEERNVLDFNIKNLRKSFNFDSIKEDAKVLDFNINNLGKSFNFDSIKEDAKVLDFNIKNLRKSFNFDSIMEDAKVLDFNIKNLKKEFNFELIKKDSKVLDFNIDNLRRTFNFDSIKKIQNLEIEIPNQGKSFSMGSFIENSKVHDFLIKNRRKTFSLDLVNDTNILDFNIKNSKKKFDFDSIFTDGNVNDFYIKNQKKVNFSQSTENSLKFVGKKEKIFEIMNCLNFALVNCKIRKNILEIEGFEINLEKKKFINPIYSYEKQIQNQIFYGSDQLKILANKLKYDAERKKLILESLVSGKGEELSFKSKKKQKILIENQVFNIYLNSQSKLKTYEISNQRELNFKLLKLKKLELLPQKFEIKIDSNKDDKIHEKYKILKSSEFQFDSKKKKNSIELIRKEEINLFYEGKKEGIELKENEDNLKSEDLKPNIKTIHKEIEFSVNPIYLRKSKRLDFKKSLKFVLTFNTLLLMIAIFYLYFKTNWLNHSYLYKNTVFLWELIKEN